MFHHKKFLAALLFAPLAVGCVINGDDDDDTGADTGTDGTVSTTATTTASTTDSTTASTTASTTDSTTVSTTDMDTGTTDADTTAGDTTTGGDGGMFCLQACAAAEDCCFDGIECGTYPNAWECNDMICEPLGCTSDDDCALVEGTTCHDVDGFAMCVPTCTVETEAEDCLVKLGEACTGMTDDGMLYCQFDASCEEDVDCDPQGTTGFVCLDDNTCGCDGDDDCANTGGTCVEGTCQCSGDSCPEGFSCVAL